MAEPQAQCARCGQRHAPQAGSTPPRFLCADCQYTLRARKSLAWLLLGVAIVLALVTRELRLW